MKKKSIVALAASVGLIAAVGMGTTLAFLTDATDQVKNTFTVGNVEISLEEPNWNPEEGEDLEPGAVVQKDPMLVNTGRNAGYMLMEVNGMDAMKEKGFAAVYDKNKWTLVNRDGEKMTSNGSLADGYYAYCQEVEAGSTTEPLFTEVAFDGEELESSYVVEAQIDKETGKITHYTIQGVADKSFASYEEAEQYVIDNFGASASYVFELSVKGYAIQTGGLDTNQDGATDLKEWVSALFAGVTEKQ